MRALLAVVLPSLVIVLVLLADVPVAAGEAGPNSQPTAPAPVMNPNSATPPALTQRATPPRLRRPMKKTSR